VETQPHSKSFGNLQLENRSVVLALGFSYTFYSCFIKPQKVADKVITCGERWALLRVSPQQLLPHWTCFFVRSSLLLMLCWGWKRWNKYILPSIHPFCIPECQAMKKKQVYCLLRPQVFVEHFRCTRVWPSTEEGAGQRQAKPWLHDAHILVVGEQHMTTQSYSLVTWGLWGRTHQVWGVMDMIESTSVQAVLGLPYVPQIGGLKQQSCVL
jgi:hypothetical protein